jgi:predicted enzyme related to lactoylglutathione lyase
VSLTIYVPDVDATYALAVERGAFGEREPADQFYGSRSGNLRDPFGHRWSVQTYLGDDGAGHEPRPDADAAGAAPTQAQDLWDEVGYYVLNVPELEPAVRFYGELLGWRFADPRPATEGTGEYAHVESSTVPFGIHGGSGSEVEWDPYIRVRDLRALVAKVRELGGTVESEEYGYESGGNAICRDDQGVRFQLWQPAEGY